MNNKIKVLTLTVTLATTVGVVSSCSNWKDFKNSKKTTFYEELKNGQSGSEGETDEDILTIIKNLLSDNENGEPLKKTNPYEISSIEEYQEHLSIIDTLNITVPSPVWTKDITAMYANEYPDVSEPLADAMVKNTNKAAIKLINLKKWFYYKNNLKLFKENQRNACDEIIYPALKNEAILRTITQDNIRSFADLKNYSWLYIDRTAKTGEMLPYNCGISLTGIGSLFQTLLKKFDDATALYASGTHTNFNRIEPNDLFVLIDKNYESAYQAYLERKMIVFKKMHAFNHILLEKMSEQPDAIYSDEFKANIVNTSTHVNLIVRNMNFNDEDIDNYLIELYQMASKEGLDLLAEKEVEKPDAIDLINQPQTGETTPKYKEPIGVRREEEN